MTGTPRRFAVCAPLLGLSACIGLEPTAVTRLETKGDSFQTALHAEYAELAVKESTLYDWTSATIFARKAEASAEGQPVAPEMPEIWGIDPTLRPESLEIAQTIKGHAESKGITPVQFAVAWVLNNRFVTASIVGPRTLEQFESYLPALDYRFTAEDEALVDELVPIGHPSTSGYNDPQYPIEGRPTHSGA